MKWQRFQILGVFISGIRLPLNILQGLWAIISRLGGSKTSDKQFTASAYGLQQSVIGLLGVPAVKAVFAPSPPDQPPQS